MKKRGFIFMVLFMIAISCDGPETTVTNFVNPDGSVLRKVEMKYSKNDFNRKNFRVPVDSTWKQTDSISISSKGDTTWYLFAEKLFENTDAINASYLADSGVNKQVARTVSFDRKFRWFTTTWHFSEKCEKAMMHGYPVEDFLSGEEITFMKTPVSTRADLMGGRDSLKYKALSDSIDAGVGKWYIKTYVSEWIEEVAALCGSSGKPGALTSDMLRPLEREIISQPDSMNFNQVMQAVLGDSVYSAFRTEIDSAEHVCSKRFDKASSFEEYTMNIVMPLKTTATNGTRLSTGEVTWTVRGELFLSSDYLMFAEARRVNYWAIIVTVALLGFITADLTGHVHKRKNRK